MTTNPDVSSEHLSAAIVAFTGWMPRSTVLTPEGDEIPYAARLDDDWVRF